MLAVALQTEIEACAARLHVHPLLLAARAGRVSPLTVAKYLRSVLYLVRHTPVHLALAQKSAEARGALELARFFAHKAGEEQGHDAWAESDLREMRGRFHGLDETGRLQVEQPGGLTTVTAGEVFGLGGA